MRLSTASVSVWFPWRSPAFRVVLVTAALIPFGPGCSDDEGGGPAGTAIDTLVNPPVILLGEAAKVSCPVVGSDGRIVLEATKYATNPATSSSGSLKPTTANTYTVQCLTADERLKDLTPAKLVVLGEGDRDRLEVMTTLSTHSAAVGEVVDVTCAVYLDKAPLQGVDLFVTATPSVGITVQAKTVKGNLDGDFDIACQIVDSSFTDLTPEVLVIGKGGSRPAKVVASVAKSPISAGESTEVTCVVTDQNGDVIDVSTFIEADEGLIVNGTLVQGAEAGEYDVTCKLGDASAAVESIPVAVVVVPAAPATFEAWAEPAKPVYKPGDVITIKWEAKDGYGNPVPDASATIAAPAAGVQSEGGPKYTLLEDGKYTFTVSLNGDTNLSDTVEVLVDGHGPLIIITSPERGQTLTGPASDTNVVVTGEVSDEWGGVSTLEVNGVPVEWNEMGKFTATIESTHGLNLVVARATDKHGNAGKASVAWYFSTDYAFSDAGTPDEAWLDNSIRVWLSQELLDDYDHLEQNCDEAGVCTPKIDDLATLLEIMITNVDFAALLGKPVLFETSFPNVINIDLGVAVLVGNMKIWIDISEISFGTATLNLDSRTGGINVKSKFVPDAQSPALRIGLSVHLKFDITASGEIDLGFKIPFSVGLDPAPEAISTAELSIDELSIDSSFDINASGGSLHVNPQAIGLDPTGAVHLTPLANVVINLGSISVKVFGGEVFAIPLGSIDLTQLVSGLNSVFDSLLSPLLTGILDLVSADILDPFISAAAGPLLEDFLGSLEINQSIDIPELIPGQPPAAVTIGAKITDAEFSDAGGRIGLTSRAVAEKQVDETPLGSILRDGCLQTQGDPYVLPQTGPMELAISLDLVNEVLYGLWYNGGLDLAITGESLAGLVGELPLEGASIALDPTLPPILSDCNAKGILQLQLGDAWIDADIPIGDIVISFTGWMSIELDAVLAMVDGKLAITINGISSFDLTVVEAGGAFADNPQALEDTVKSLLNSLLGDLIGSALTGIEIPKIELDTLLPGVPSGTALQLDGLSLKKTKGFLQLEGALK